MLIFLFLFLSLGFYLAESEAQGGAKLARSIAELNTLFPEADTCQGCHPQHYAEWKKSYHSQSLITILGGFKKYIQEKGKLSKEDYLACINCHAPTLKLATEELVQNIGQKVVEGRKEELAKFSITCSYCHTYGVTSNIEKEVYYGPIEDPLEASGVHQSRYAEKISQTEFCQECHMSAKAPEVYCSLIYESWKASSVSAEKECQYCHMQSRDGLAAENIKGAPQRVIHEHIFPGGHFPSILQNAVRLNISANLVKNKAIMTVNIRNLAGHRIPDS
jgi:hypothetical protein